MSKKMKIFTAGALGIMMAGLVCTNVYALDNKDVVGTWYANSLSMDGMNEFHPNAIMMEMSMEISEDGKGKVTTSSESEEADVNDFEWKIDGDNIIITSDDEVLDTNALVLKSTEEKTEEDTEDYSLFDTDTMRLYLLDDGKLCFTSADSMDDPEETEEAADGEDSEDSMDWTVKVFFDKLEKK